MQTSKIKGYTIIVLLIIIATAFCTSFHNNERTVPKTTYTVQNGDTLYSIAEEYGIKNWRKWSYETCKINGIEHGGLIYPVQIIVISTDGR